MLKVIFNLNFMILGKQFRLEAKIRVNEKKRSSSNKITGIQVFLLKKLHCKQRVLLFTSLINNGTPNFIAVFPEKPSESSDHITRFQS